MRFFFLVLERPGMFAANVERLDSGVAIALQIVHPLVEVQIHRLQFFAVINIQPGDRRAGNHLLQGSGTLHRDKQILVRFEFRKIGFYQTGRFMRYDTFAVREKLDAFERRGAACIKVDRFDFSGSGNVDQPVGVEKRSNFGITLLRVRRHQRGPEVGIGNVALGNGRHREGQVFRERHLRRLTVEVHLKGFVEEWSIDAHAERDTARLNCQHIIRNTYVFGLAVLFITDIHPVLSRIEARTHDLDRSGETGLHRSAQHIANGHAGNNATVIGSGTGSRFVTFVITTACGEHCTGHQGHRKKFQCFFHNHCFFWLRLFQFPLL